MRYLYILLIAIGFSISFSSCSSSDDEITTDDTTIIEQPTLEAVTFTDVSYGADPQQVYDLYLPEGRTAEATKVIVLIHGGGWTSGDKSDMAASVAFVQAFHPDHAIVNVNYVLATVSGTPAFPNQYLDIQAVINQITTQSEALQILPEFGMIGTSAGAHLAMMYDYVYDTNDQVKFVINIVGPSDFTDPFYTNDPTFNIALNLLVDEDQFPEGTNYAVANSPALQVTANSSPTLLFYGDQDPLVPLSNGMQLDSHLNTANVPHLFTVYQGGHGNDWSEESTLDLTLKSSEYINTYLPVIIQ
ncbi:lipase [Dokdonia pacifica]|uniref:Acetyl esterase/lipase n=1 Tax=Dokdonia pacifica TaxID=1627892 RepID=A0A239B0E9_9FLAO|nr:alpha/beta hydrolase [Dokdonia pacifica]GGG32630.1 lipase [Dokdonia pacifica]SNS01081.1 Acetyl esterase/lipase [Dokdonia pacifica]